VFFRGGQEKVGLESKVVGFVLSRKTCILSRQLSARLFLHLYLIAERITVCRIQANHFSGISGNLEMSGISAEVREKSGKKVQSQGKVREFVYSGEI